MEERLQCYICNKEDNEGIILLNKYICRGCELEITSTSLEELKYEIIKRSIKSIYKTNYINFDTTKKFRYC